MVLDPLQALRQAGYNPEIVEDTSFEPFKGRYICRFDSAGRLKGSAKKTGDPYDFIAINLQVVEVVNGDSAINRYIKKNYSPDEAGLKKLLDDLFTAGIECGAGSLEDLEAFLPTLKDKTVNVSAWISKEFTAKDGTVVPGGKQVSRIVNKFKETTKEKPSEVKGNVPF